LGFSPILLFELRHNFYNLQTLLLFLTHRSQVGNNPFVVPSDYYFLSLSFFSLLAICPWLKKIKLPLVPIFIVLIVTDLYLYLPSPPHGFRMSAGWNYPGEFKVHSLIMAENLSHYNVANLIYDPQAAVQKYLLKKAGKSIDIADYTTNKYLFILSDANEYLVSQADEVASHRPFQITKQWPITNRYNLYLTIKK
jgi:hypothetical protein